MNNALTNYLSGKIKAAGPPRRPPDFTIGDPARPYMHRWHLIPANRLFTVYLHHILRSDDDRAFHDHPSASLSLMIAGEMNEHYYDNTGGGCRRDITPGSLIYRGSTFAHMLVIPRGKSAWTVFIMGPRWRTWGFHCPNGWRPWTEYVKGEAPGEVGPGCD